MVRAFSGLGPDGAVAGACSGERAINIVDLAAGNELEGSLVVEEAHHMRCRFEEGVHLVGLVVVTENLPEVCPEGLLFLVDSFGLRQRVARRPGPASGPGGGTAADR